MAIFYLFSFFLLFILAAGSYVQNVIPTQSRYVPRLVSLSSIRLFLATVTRNFYDFTDDVSARVH